MQMKDRRGRKLSDIKVTPKSCSKYLA